jgi:hypothetical protein
MAVSRWVRSMRSCPNSAFLSVSGGIDQVCM